jgi:hypothetical protein
VHQVLADREQKMKLTVYIVDSKKEYEDSSPKEIAAWAQTHGFVIEHKIEAISGQDNKANLIDPASILLMVKGTLLDFLMEEYQHAPFNPDDYSIAFEYNGKWGKL